MNISEEQHIKLLRFLEGKMNLDEINLLKKELSENTHLKFHLDLLISLEVSSLSENNEGKGGKVTYSSYFIRAIAASIVLIISISIITFYNDHNKSNTKFSIKKDTNKQNQDSITKTAQERNINRTKNNSSVDSTHNNALHKTKKKNVAIPPSEFLSDFDNLLKKDTVLLDIPAQIEKMAIDYKNGNYYDVQNFELNTIKPVRSLAAGSKDKKEIIATGLYLKGISYVETKNYDSAITCLENSKKDIKNNEFKTKCNWYLALLYTRNNETNKAIPLFKFIINSSADSYKKQSVEILKSIQNRR